MRLADKRLPDRCSRHPDAGLVETRVDNPSLDNWLVQHYCGAATCLEGTGWIAKTPGTGQRHGPGICGDQAVLSRLNRTNHEGTTFIVALMACMAALVLWTAGMALTPHTQMAEWTRLHTIWVPPYWAAAITLIVTYVTHRVRTKPPLAG